MNNSDERDYAEEEYNRAEMEREAQEERKAELNHLYRRIIANTIEAAKMWEKSTQATNAGNASQAQRFAQQWADTVNRTKVAEQRFRNLADF